MLLSPTPPMPSREEEQARVGAWALSVLDLCCRRGGLTVLDGLSLELRPGQAVELRGANGSGKTSLLRLLAGLAPSSAGEIRWDGQPMRPGDLACARRMAYLGHHNALSADLSAVENLLFSAQLHDAMGGATPAQALQAWGLAALAERPVRQLSQGQRRRLALARVWMSRRPLWLLDEPCAALDRTGQSLFDELLCAHLAAGGAAVVATHRALAIPAAALRPLDLDGQARREAHAQDHATAC